MKSDSRLSWVLHVMLHMADSDRPLTSEEIATFLDTHPVVVRRVLGGLRRLGFVAAAKGRGGGWTIACDLKAVTLRDVYEAVGMPSVLAIGHRTVNPKCLVEQAVNTALGDAFRAAEALLLARLGEVSLAELSADFRRRMAAHPRKRHAHAH